MTIRTNGIKPYKIISVNGNYITLWQKIKLYLLFYIRNEFFKIFASCIYDHELRFKHWTLTPRILTATFNPDDRLNHHGYFYIRVLSENDTCMLYESSAIQVGFDQTKIKYKYQGSFLINELHGFIVLAIKNHTV